MAQQEILEQISKLPAIERLSVIEAALHLLHNDMQYVELPSSQLNKSQQLAYAAELLLKDYSTDSELRAFTALDGEDLRRKQ